MQAAVAAPIFANIIAPAQPPAAFKPPSPMNELIQSVERRQLRRVPDFRQGDRVRVHVQVVEGARKRTQVFEGVVLKLQGPGARRTFTVRKLSFGVGVERTFPLHSPKIERIEVMARGEVRRAKLYYLRGRVGRRARVRERRDLTPEEIAGMGVTPEELEQAEVEQAQEAVEVGEDVDSDADADVDAGKEGDSDAAADSDPKEPRAEEDPETDPKNSNDDGGGDGGEQQDAEAAAKSDG